MAQSRPFSHTQHRPDLPDFRQLSSAERSRLAEAIWEGFVAAHPESAEILSGQGQSSAHDAVHDGHDGAGQSWSGALARPPSQSPSHSTTQPDSRSH